jgi:UDP-N-acetyl-D-glucosamine dehydrogenase
VVGLYWKIDLKSGNGFADDDRPGSRLILGHGLPASLHYRTVEPVNFEPHMPTTSSSQDRSRSVSAQPASKPSPADSAARALEDRLQQRTATIGIVGLGYVGLPLARAVFDAGYGVIGYDVDESKVVKLKAGEPYLHHLGTELIAPFAKSERFTPTSDARELAHADVIILCVPTPLGQHNEPDISYVVNSTRMVAEVLRAGQLVVLESTTYPGTTRKDMQPILDASGLRCGHDYFLAYSPEREDPGRQNLTTAAIPKLVGGVDDVSTDLAMAFYTRCIQQVHRVSSAEVAETAKLLENIFRGVNIALVNELKVVLTEMGIDIWEVIAAASTKPFGFMPFYPGPGLGGHCIPIDPFYLTWKAKEYGRYTKFIELAGEINKHMPEYVVGRLALALNEDSKAMKGAKVLVIGIAYKPNVDDIRESPAAEVIELLWKHGVEVSYHDPHCPKFPKMRQHSIDLASAPLTEATAREADAVLIITHHDAIDYGLLGRSARLIVDSRNAMGRVPTSQITARVVKA